VLNLQRSMLDYQFPDTYEGFTSMIHMCANISDYLSVHASHVRCRGFSDLIFNGEWTISCSSMTAVGDYTL
jgi:hypothetical protein